VATRQSPQGEPRRLERLASGRAAPLAAIAWKAVVAAELLGERVADGLSRGPTATGDMGAKVTALVKTFERPRTLRRMLASLRRSYPDLPVVVVDDSREPRPLDDPRVKTVAMPFDVGLSAGRNEGLRHISTPYVLLLDDDFVFHRGTRIETAVLALEADERLDIVGGKVIDLPLYRVMGDRDGALLPSDSRPLVPYDTLVAGLPVRRNVANFFVARVASLQRVGWDEEMPMAEHTDFFTRACGVLVTAYDDALGVLHAGTPFDRPYMGHKDENVASGHAALARKYVGEGPSPPAGDDTTERSRP
jgi:glycosyltransferase involved in cell wall biosynthesis